MNKTIENYLRTDIWFERDKHRYFKSYHEGNVITVYQGCSFFSYLFEDEIYQQTGSVATGSPLDPILAVPFMVELETTIVPTLDNLLCKGKKICRWYHSHKKRKDSLERSLDRVLLSAELEFTKILVPRLPQHTLDVNIECAAKSKWSKQQCSLHVTSFLEHWYILILLSWYQSVFYLWCLV